MLRIERCVALGLVALGLAACSGDPPATFPPTQTLIPFVASDTPRPATATATITALPGPGDIATAIPANVFVPTSTQPLVNAVLDDLATILNVERNTIQIILLEAAIWTTTDLGCGEIRVPGGQPAIEGYRFVLQVEETVYEYHTDGESSVRRCERPGVIAGYTVTLLEADPIAAELAALAQRSLAERLDLPVRRIRVVTVTAMTWLDTSLGCPLPGQQYAPMRADGYRIVLAVGNEEYIFHSNAERVTPCDEDNEQLPEATPTQK